MGAGTAFLTGFVDAANQSRYEKRMAEHEESIQDRADYTWKMQTAEEERIDIARATALAGVGTTAASVKAGVDIARASTLAGVQTTAATAEVQARIDAAAQARTDKLKDEGDAETKENEARIELFKSMGYDQATAEAAAGLGPIVNTLLGQNYIFSKVDGRPISPAEQKQQRWQQLYNNFVPQNVDPAIWQTSPVGRQVYGMGLEKWQEFLSEEGNELRHNIGPEGNFINSELIFATDTPQPHDIQSWEATLLRTATLKKLNSANTLERGVILGPNKKPIDDDQRQVMDVLAQRATDLYLRTLARGGTATFQSVTNQAFDPYLPHIDQVTQVNTKLSGDLIEQAATYEGGTDAMITKIASNDAKTLVIVEQNISARIDLADGDIIDIGNQRGEMKAFQEAIRGNAQFIEYIQEQVKKKRMGKPMWLQRIEDQAAVIVPTPVIEPVPVITPVVALGDGPTEPIGSSVGINRSVGVRQNPRDVNPEDALSFEGDDALARMFRAEEAWNEAKIEADARATVKSQELGKVIDAYHTPLIEFIKREFGLNDASNRQLKQLEKQFNDARGGG